jgi:hypothetical protein
MLVKLVPVPVIVWMVVAPVPVFRLLLAFEMGEVTVVAMIFGRPPLVRVIFAIIPIVVILVILVVVAPLVFVVPIPMFVILMLIVLKLGTC